jgi:DNA-directed RNA polymerase specialized sigma24 family protein
VADDENSPDAPVPGYLQAMLRQLPQRQREVVVLRLLEECSVRDTAVILGCREGTVKAHLAKAVTNMRAIVTAQGIDTEELWS